jgi:neural Wiskott-Aldrich syndrome protein
MPQSLADELKSISMSPNLGESLDRAHRFARDQSHRLVMLEHLLLALTDDPEAAIILQSANVDLTRLRADVSGYLGGLMEDMRADGTVEPRPDGELLRVLQAAASAATQSRRRQIDGAIVLAAIVGDAKSPAAGLLKALGMTFEEAIRALQRANAQARFKGASATAAAAPAETQAQAGQVTSAPDGATPAMGGTGDAIPASPQLPSSHSPDDFLAAARARIKQRAAAAAAANSKAPEAEPAPAAAADNAKPPAEPVPPEPMPATSAGAAPHGVSKEGTGEGTNAASDLLADPEDLSDPSRESVSSLTERLAAAAVAPKPARQAWPPAAQRRGPPGPQGPAQPPPGPAPTPFPARALQPGEGPPRPPLPPRSGMPPQARPGLPNRPGRAPRPDPEHARPVGAPVPNGSLGSSHYPAAEPHAPNAIPIRGKRARPGAPRTATHPDKPHFAETIPRRLQLGTAVRGEVRISRGRIDSLLSGTGRGPPHPPESFAARALTVRLKAAGGGIAIEPASPETQWLEAGSNLAHADHAMWRWTLLPRKVGRNRLVLQVSVRTIGNDGVASDTALPDRVIDAKVRRHALGVVMRALGWLVPLLIGAAGAYFGREAFDSALPIIKSMFGS